MSKEGLDSQMLERHELIPQRTTLRIHGHNVLLDVSKSASLPTCSFLGPEGTYAQQAAQELLDDQVDYVSSVRITEVLRALDTGRYDVGIVPIENSSEGNVAESIRGIIRSDLNILGEKVLPIQHVIFGSAGALAKRIVRSHPQAIGQCVNWLELNLPDAEFIVHNSTSDAIRVAAEKDELAIGNLNAARLYDIPVLEEHINDFKGNTTRFWLMGRGETDITDTDRTTLLFSLKNRQGLLRKALGVFADRAINITKIDSFPIGALDEYYFLLTLDGHAKDPIVADSLEVFKNVCLKVRAIGSYHKAPIPDKYLEPDAISNGWLEP